MKGKPLREVVKMAKALQQKKDTEAEEAVKQGRPFAVGASVQALYHHVHPRDHYAWYSATIAAVRRVRPNEVGSEVGFPPSFSAIFNIGKCRNCPLFSCIFD